MTKFVNGISAILAGLAGLLSAGCQSTHALRSAEPSGFLSNYGQLREGTGNQAQMVYINPNVNFAKYGKLIIEPVEIYVTPDSAMGRLSPEDQASLVNYFGASLHEHLQADYQIASVPGPDVMVLRAAITEAKGSKVLINTVTSVVPMALAMSALKRVVFGTNTGVATVRAEMEILDSQSGERLGAAVDGRAGKKFTGQFDKFSKWAQVRDSFDFWASRVQTRLAELRSAHP